MFGILDIQVSSGIKHVSYFRKYDSSKLRAALRFAKLLFSSFTLTCEKASLSVLIMISKVAEMTALQVACNLACTVKRSQRILDFLKKNPESKSRLEIN